MADLGGGAVVGRGLLAASCALYFGKNIVTWFCCFVHFNNKNTILLTLNTT